MWRNHYRDYPPDSDWIHHKVESNKGIIGCEMHERNGWGETHHCRKESKGWISRLLGKLLSVFRVKDPA